MAALRAGAKMVSIEDGRLPAPLTAPASGNSHKFQRVQGRTYSVCTVCGVLQRTPAENAAVPCTPKAQPIREEEPKLGSPAKPFGK